MQSHAEHEKHDADFHQFTCHLHVRHRPPGILPRHDAGKKVPHEGRHLDAFSEIPENKCQAKSNGQSRNKRQRVFHGCDSA